MVVRSDRTVVGGGCNVISVSKGASRWSKESTLCVGRQQVSGGRERGVVNRGVVCMGEGCWGVGVMQGWASVLFKKKFRSFRSFPFFSVLFRSL